MCDSGRIEGEALARAHTAEIALAQQPGFTLEELGELDRAFELDSGLRATRVSIKRKIKASLAALGGVGPAATDERTWTIWRVRGHELNRWYIGEPNPGINPDVLEVVEVMAHRAPTGDQAEGC